MDERNTGEERVGAGEGRVAPTGRDARLWRVLLELSRAVVEAKAAAAAAERASESPHSGPKPKPLAPGHLERLVVEFDDAYTTFVEGMVELPSEAQLMSLQAIDRQLSSMVRAQEAELWTGQALRDDVRWRDAQRLAHGVIEAFAWPSLRLVLVAGSSEGGDAASEVSRGAPGRPRSRS